MKKASPFLALFLLLLCFVPTSKLPGLNNVLEGVPSIGQFFLYPKSFHHNSRRFENDLSLPGDGFGDVKVGFDTHGVPHIFAENKKAAFFGFGYSHARDRLFQMEMLRRTVLGRLSEVVGMKALKRDKFWIKFGFEESSVAWAEAIASEDPEMYQQLEAYCSGVNKYLEFMRFDALPIEFKLLGFEPMQMEVSHIFLLIKYMDYDLNYSEQDLGMEQVYQSLGASLTEFYYPSVSPYAIPIHSQAKLTLPPSNRIEKPSFSRSNFEEQSANFSSPSDLGKGSNNWAVSGNKSANGHAMLCNDMHLSLNLPGIWYETHLSIDGRVHHGLSLAGAPFIISGFTDSLAWGLTNATWNLCDFYKLEWNKEGQYRFDEKWLNPKLDTVFINVRNGKPIAFVRGRTEFGILDTISGNVFALNWLALESSQEASAMRALLDANNIKEGLDAVEQFSQPPQNVILADKTGEIAICSAGDIAWHKEVYAGLRKANGKEDQVEYLPSHEMLKSVGGEQGFLFSANQPSSLDRSILDHLGSRFASNARARRIASFLSSKEKLSKEDMFVLQADKFDGEWPILRSKLINVAEGTALELLEEWDGNCDTASIAATIFIEFKSTLAKEFIELLNPGLSLPPQSEHIFNLISRQKKLPTTSDSIKVDNLVTDAYNRAIRSLETEFGSLENAVYGDYHKVQFKHITGLEALSSKAYPLGGSNRSVNVAPGRMVNFGASERSLVIMDPRGPRAYYCIAGGQSGRFNSKNYQDQIEQWHGLGYRALILPQTFNENEYESTIIFKDKTKE